MEEKPILKVLETLGKKISDLEFEIYMKNLDIKSLNEEIEKLKGGKSE